MLMRSTRAVVLLALVSLTVASHGSSDKDELHTEDYEELEDEHHKPHWSYHGDYPPDRWHDLFEQCTASNRRQSPIDIEPMNTIFEDDLTKIELIEHYSKYRKLNVRNNGHTVVIDIEHEVFVAGGDLPSKGYRLVGIHFHWGSNNQHGSEHTVDGKRYPLEMHMVNYDSERYPDVSEAVSGENSLAVLSTMFKLSEEDNPALIPLISALRKVDEPDSSITIKSFPITDLLPRQTDKYFRYEGSLTTPPCAESVIWTLFLHTQTISSSQLREFRELVSGYDAYGKTHYMEDNFRPVQPTHSRVVYRSFLFKSEYSKVVASYDAHPGAQHGGATVSNISIITGLMLLLANFL